MTQPPAFPGHCSGDQLSLREAAIAAIAEGHSQPIVEVIDTSDAAPDRLVEELRVYHTELELQAAQLREVNARLEVALTRARQLFELLPYPAMVVDPLGQVVSANRSSHELLGLEARSALLGPLLRRILEHDQDQSALQMTLLTAQSTGRAQLRDLSLRGRGNHRYRMDLRVTLLDEWDDLGGTRLLVQCVDRTREYELEGLLAERESETTGPAGE